MIIDSHIHFWVYDPTRDAWITDEMKCLRQNFLPENIEPVLVQHGIDGVVAVQADQSEMETRFLLKLAKANPFIKAVIGWIDLRDERVEERLQHYAQFPVIKGWRHIVQAEPKGFLESEEFLRGIKKLKHYNYTYDILIYPHQLRDANQFIQKISDQRVVIDHGAKPDIKNREIKEWTNCMRELAQIPTVYCKISGLLTETNWQQWSPTDFYPYLDVLFECFGTDRLLFGSDWPVMLLSGAYTDWKNIVENYLANFSLADRQKIFGGNAIHFYKI